MSMIAPFAIDDLLRRRQQQTQAMEQATASLLDTMQPAQPAPSLMPPSNWGTSQMQPSAVDPAKPANPAIDAISEAVAPKILFEENQGRTPPMRPNPITMRGQHPAPAGTPAGTSPTWEAMKSLGGSAMRAMDEVSEPVTASLQWLLGRMSGDKEKQRVAEGRTGQRATEHAIDRIFSELTPPDGYDPIRQLGRGLSAAAEAGTLVAGPVEAAQGARNVERFAGDLLTPAPIPPGTVRNYSAGLPFSKSESAWLDAQGAAEQAARDLARAQKTNPAPTGTELVKQKVLERRVAAAQAAADEAQEAYVTTRQAIEAKRGEGLADPAALPEPNRPLDMTDAEVADLLGYKTKPARPSQALASDDAARAERLQGYKSLMTEEQAAVYDKAPVEIPYQPHAGGLEGNLAAFESAIEESAATGGVKALKQALQRARAKAPAKGDWLPTVHPTTEAGSQQRALLGETEGVVLGKPRALSESQAAAVERNAVMAETMARPEAPPPVAREEGSLARIMAAKKAARRPAVNALEARQAQVAARQTMEELPPSAGLANESQLAARRAQLADRPATQAPQMDLGKSNEAADLDLQRRILAHENVDESVVASNQLRPEPEPVVATGERISDAGAEMVDPAAAPPLPKGAIELADDTGVIQQAPEGPWLGRSGLPGNRGFRVDYWMKQGKTLEEAIAHVDAIDEWGNPIANAPKTPQAKAHDVPPGVVEKAPDVFALGKKAPETPKGEIPADATPEEATEIAQKTYALTTIPKQQIPALHQAGESLPARKPGILDRLFHRTSRTRFVPPPQEPVGHLPGQKLGWEPMYKPEQAKHNPPDVPPVGQFHKYAGLGQPEELVKERSVLKRGLIEHATLGTSEYAHDPARQLQVDFAQRAKTDLYHRMAEMNTKHQAIAAEVGSAVRTTHDTLSEQRAVDKALTDLQRVPGTDSSVTRWQLAKSKFKHETLTAAETAALEPMQQAVSRVGEIAERWGFALMGKGKQLVPFKRGNNWPDYHTPEHWHSLRDDAAYAEKYFDELKKVNAHYGHDIGDVIDEYKESILRDTTFTEAETNFEHARLIPVHIAGFEYKGKFHQVTISRLGGQGGYLEHFLKRAPAHLAWNHYFGQNFNEIGEGAIQAFKKAHPGLPTPRSVLEDFKTALKEGGYQSDMKGLELADQAIHGTTAESTMDKLGGALTDRRPSPMRQFFNDVFGFAFARMTDEVAKYNIAQPFAAGKSVHGGGTWWKPETGIEFVKTLFGKRSASLGDKGLDSNPFQRMAREWEKVANAYIEKQGNIKTASAAIDKLALKDATENLSSSALLNLSNRYFDDLVKMAERGPLSTGRIDTLRYTVGMPDSFIEALERLAQMPAGKARTELHNTLRDAYLIQGTKRTSHIGQSPLFRTRIEMWDKSPLVAPFSSFAREPAQMMGHMIEMSRQLLDGIRHRDPSLLAESLRRAAPFGVGLGITGATAYYASQLLRNLRGQESQKYGPGTTIALFMAQGFMGKLADQIQPLLQKGGDLKQLATFSSPHLSLPADVANPFYRQLTMDDADLLHDIWRDVVMKYAPGRMVSAYLGAGILAAQELKRELMHDMTAPVPKPDWMKPAKPEAKQTLQERLDALDAGKPKQTLAQRYDELRAKAGRPKRLAEQFDELQKPRTKTLAEQYDELQGANR